MGVTVYSTFMGGRVFLEDIHEWMWGGCDWVWVGVGRCDWMRVGVTRCD